jgi:hypothetical protein
MKYVLTLMALWTGILINISCNKVEIPDPKQDGLPFGLSGTLDGAPFAINLDQAGINLETSSEQYDNVWIFKGKLARLNNNGITPSEFELGIRHRIETADSNITDQKPFDPQNWFFFQRNGQLREFSPLLISVENNEGIQINRIVLENGTGILGQPAYEFRMDKREAQRVCVHYTYKQRMSFFCTQIPESNLNQISLPNWDIRTQNDSLRNAVLQVVFADEIKSVKWQNDQEGREITTSEPGRYNVRIEDKNDQFHVHSKDLIWNSVDSKFETYGSSIMMQARWKERTQVLDQKQTRSIVIKIRDNQGKLLSSDIPQGPEASFRIIESRPYLNNAKGEPTIALKVEINCLLETEEGKKVALRNFEGWIAVGLPG